MGFNTLFPFSKFTRQTDGRRERCGGMEEEEKENYLISWDAGRPLPCSGLISAVSLDSVVVYKQQQTGRIC